MRRINGTHASDQRPQSPSRVSTNVVATPRRATSVERRPFLAKDTRIQSSPFTPGSASRRLWPSSSGTFSSLQAISTASLLDVCPETKRKVEFGDPILRPAANGVQRSLDLTGQRKTPERKGTIAERKRTPTSRRPTTDQTENAQPTEAIRSKVHAHGTPTRRRISTVQPEIARPAEAIQLKASDRTAQKFRGEGKAQFLSRSLDLGTPRGSIPTRNAAAMLIQASSQAISSPRSFRSASTTRGSSSALINDSVSRRPSPDIRGVRRDASIDGQRKSDSMQQFQSNFELHMPAIALTKSKSIERTKTSPSFRESMVSDSKTIGSSRAPSPMKGRSLNFAAGAQSPITAVPPPKIGRLPSPLRGLQSPTKSRVASSLLLSGGSPSYYPKSPLGGAGFSIEGAKGRRATVSHMEDALLLKVLQNRWIQWRFVNARADAVLNLQRAFAEASLINVWTKTACIRTSVATQRVKLQEARQSIKLDSILSSYAIHLDAASTLQEEHLGAVQGMTDALKMATVIIPVTGGAKADLQVMKEIIGHAVELMKAVGVIGRTLALKVTRLDKLVSELAAGAAEEMALLTECSNLLARVSILEMEEYSLRAHFMQIQNGKSGCVLDGQ